jgi:hypothetical protein
MILGYIAVKYVQINLITHFMIKSPKLHSTVRISVLKDWKNLGLIQNVYKHSN